ncbi:MAG: hypothetical protein WC861_00040 [Candidatus Micrarchaeia archaeon]|jgi:hypothetical protein
MRFFAFVLAFAAFALGMAYAYGSPCADGTPYGQCSSANPGSWCTGIAQSPSLGLLLSKCPCSKYNGYVQEGTGDDATCVQAKCADGTMNGQCSAVTKPKVCVGGTTYSDNATKCGCPAGKRAAAGGIFCEFIPCTDGDVSVPEGTCSAKKQKKCVGGVLVDKASECGCATGQTLQGETCGVVCLDGTKDGACSATKPKECTNGYLLDNAVKCGCPEGLSAVGKQCTNSILGSTNGADLLGGAGNGTGVGAGGSSALSCCCLPTALIGIIGGFAFFRKNG